MKQRGIKAVRHATLEVGSDHRAVLVELVIVNDSHTTRVKGGTINLGPARVGHVLGVLLPALGPRGFLCIQEAGGQTDLVLDYADAYKWRLLGRTGPVGAASTIVLVGPAISTRAPWARRLLRRVFFGKGAGPSWGKPKFANGGRVACEGVAFGIWCIHEPASHQFHRRLMWAIRMTQGLTAATFDRRVPWIVGGDWNTNLDKQRGLALWLLDHGWTSNHRELGVLATHGRRTIDALMWRKSDNL